MSGEQLLLVCPRALDCKIMHYCKLCGEKVIQMSNFAFVFVPNAIHDSHNSKADKGQVGAGKLRLSNCDDDNLWPNGRTSHWADIFTRTSRKCLIFVMAHCSSRNFHVLSGSIFPYQPDGGGAGVRRPQISQISYQLIIH